MERNMSAAASTGSGSDLRLSIPSPPERGGLESAQEVRLLTERHAALLAEWQRTLPTRDRIRDRKRQALVNAVGEQTWARFLGYSRQQRETSYGLGNISPDAEGLRRLGEAKRAAHEAALDLIRDAGVDEGKLRAIQAEFAQDIERTAEPTPPSFQPPRGKEGSLRLFLGEIPPEFEPPSEVSWHRRTAPYDGWAWSWAWRRRGGRDPGIYEYGLSGGSAIGCLADWDNDSAGDDDFLDFWFDGSLGFWYYTPAAGRIQMRARLGIAAFPSAQVLIEDEWGWSDSNTWMRNFVYCDISPPSGVRQTEQAWWVHVWGNPYPYFVYRFTTPEPSIWVDFTSTPIPGPGWVWISVGTYDDYQVDLNDVSHGGIMWGVWDVSEINVRTV